MADFSITQIPGIMDSNDWRVASELLRQWFAGPENAIPENGIPSLGRVKMDWVLGFERAKVAHNRIFAEGLWKTPNARKEMLAVLRRRGLLIPRASSVYDRSKVRLPLTHNDHVQFIGVGGGNWEMATAPIDHLTAALARFNFHVIALGGIEAMADRPGTYAFTVVELGVYVRDSYDFNDKPGEDQELGRWDPDDNSVSRTFLGGGTIVHNSDFQKWRAANKKGGDYLIYSDVKYTALGKPETVMLGV